MFGLTVAGTRESVADSQNTYSDEWYSPDLQMDLSVERRSPQLGEVTLKVSGLVRGQPDPSWFAIPSGYQFVSGRNQ
jgi:hypothetical protein